VTIDPKTALAAAIVATAGVWWFQFVLKKSRGWPPATRYGVYALVWLAYFVLTIILAGRSAELVQ
jgi:hypothetical protein